MMDFANIFIVGTATLLPISFIQRWRVDGNKKSSGNPYILHASDFVIFL